MTRSQIRNFKMKLIGLCKERRSNLEEKFKLRNIFCISVLTIFVGQVEVKDEEPAFEGGPNSALLDQFRHLNCAKLVSHEAPTWGTF